MRLRVLAALLSLALTSACHSGLDGEVPETPFATQRARQLLAAAGPALEPGLPTRFSRQGDFLRRVGAEANEPGLPAHAARPFTVKDDRSGLSLRARLLGADGAVQPQAAQGLLVYPAAFQGADLWFRATATGVEDYLLFERAQPTEVSYELELSDEVAGLRLVENTLELLDAHGDPRLRLAAPRLFSAGHAPVPATVTLGGCAVDRSGAPPWGRPVVSPGSRTCVATLRWDAKAARLPVVLDPQWSRTGSLALARTAHQSVTIKSRGLVLACGGYDSAGVNTTSCETFNEVTGTWAASPSMPIPRAEFTLTYLDLPMVVALGGYSNGAETATIHLLETTNFSWTSSSQTLFLNQGVANHQAVAISPSVLVVMGGQRGSGNCINRVGTIATYNAATDTFTQLLQALNEGRAYHQATLISSGPAAGQILVTGGVQTCCLLNCPGPALQGELFNPSTSSVTQVGAMRAPGRLLAASYPLADGGVLVAGGYLDLANLVGYASSEVYTFGAGFSDAGALPFQAGAPAFGLLSNGTPLLAGGGTDGGTRAEGRSALWSNSAWALDGPLNDARRGASSTVLPSGRVMVSGGAFGPAASPTELATTEVFGLLDAGASCVGDGLCASQHCSPQGVCCDTACTGACESCNQTGSLGVCKPSPAGFVCHASTGGCDPAEVCNGLDAGCPTDVIYDAGVVCRPAVGTCDVSEICTGTTQCPADVLRPPGFVCRPDAGACDVAESCDGLQGQCPVDSFVGPGATCRPSAGVCDLSEVCTGSAPGCPPDQVRTNTFLCRGASDLCDRPEFCDGFDAGCPADELQDAGHVCRGAAGTCDFAEVCTGATASCPVDAVFDAGVVCRADAGPCDVAESCTGASGLCPADGFLPTTVVCRAAAGVCDVAESCTGAAAACPTDVRAPSTLTCRPRAGSCDVAEACDGTAVDCPSDQVRPQGQVCDVLSLCDGADAGCPASCTTASDCANGAVCTAGQCRGGKGPGQSCTSPLECQNGLCVDGVCCDVACDGACEACNRPGKLGTCGAVPAGNVGDPSCNPFVCDGNNRSCPTSCSSSSQCAPGLNCVGGLCRDTKPPGAACANGMQCASGFCTDGVCCDAKCDGACEACNVAGKEGACTPAAKGEGGAPACAPYACDGTHGDCPSACTVDADCSAGTACVKGACSPKKLGHVGFGCSCGSGGFEGLAALGLAFLLRRRRAGATTRARPLLGVLVVLAAASPVTAAEPAASPPASAATTTAPAATGVQGEATPAAVVPDSPRLHLGGAVLVDVVSQQPGFELNAAYSAVPNFSVGAAVLLGNSVGLSVLGDLHTAWLPDRNLRPFAQLRGVAHFQSGGYGGGLWAGATYELGPGRVRLGPAVEGFAPRTGYYSFAVLVMGGYELDLLRSGGTVVAERNNERVVERVIERVVEKPTPATFAEPQKLSLFRGRLVNLEDKPVNGTVRLRGKVYDASPTFEVEVPPGRYGVEAEAPGYLVRGTEIVIREGETTNHDFVLRPMPSSPTAILQGGEVKITQQIQFEFGKADILPASFFILDEVVDVVLRTPSIEHLLVEGHTDDVGGAEMNQKLSEARADAVLRYLVEHGVPAKKLTSKGFGLSKPIDTNRTDAGRANNRRVQFRIVPAP